MKIDRLKKDILEAFSSVRMKKPLVEQITNYVTINDCANVTLAIGASPVMGDSFDEADQMTSISDSLVINFGGIGKESLATMIKAGRIANEKNIGIVFDPVGVGATKYRNDSVFDFLKEVHPSIIKGNASEILYLSGENVKTKGVDSELDSLLAKDAAIKVANKYNCVCAVTGKVDIITDGRIVVTVENQSDKLAYITGTGCMIASLCGSFLGATKNPLVSAICGVVSMSLCGEMALEDGVSIGTYRQRLMDNIFELNAQKVEKYGKINFQRIESKYSMYLVTDEKACLGKDFYCCVEDALKGGAKVVQLREKEMDTGRFYERALRIKGLCEKYNALFIVNDRIDIALAVDSDGIHIGQSDMPIEIARRLIGHNKIIGISAKSYEEAKIAQDKGADYIGMGAVYNTITKSDTSIISDEEVEKIIENVHIPVLAIGGINMENVDKILKKGADGVCIISDILNNDDCKMRTEEFVKIIKANY